MAFFSIYDTGIAQSRAAGPQACCPSYIRYPLNFIDMIVFPDKALRKQASIFRKFRSNIYVYFAAIHYHHLLPIQNIHADALYDLLSHHKPIGLYPDT